MLGIRGNRLKAPGNNYKANYVLCDLSGVASATKTLYPGVYIVRAQGAGGGGGRNGYFGNGQGGGSGAGFEGTLKVWRKIPVAVSTGAGGAQQVKGTDTIIGGIWTLGAGLEGSTESAAHIANAGPYTFNSSADWEIVSYKVAQNGIQGVEATSSGDFVSGGNSVLTNSGGGTGNDDATAPGAGGGGGFQWHFDGGAGGVGECLIKFISLY